MDNTELTKDLAACVEALEPNTSARGFTSYNTDGEEKAAIFVAKHHEAVADALCLLETCYGILPRERGPAGEIVREYIAELQARCEAAERDAARYRWLRNAEAGALDQPFIGYRNAHGFSQFFGDYADTAIDASREVGNG